MWISRLRHQITFDKFARYRLFINALEPLSFTHGFKTIEGHITEQYNKDLEH
jgi:hypothetical protein